MNKNLYSQYEGSKRRSRGREKKSSSEMDRVREIYDHWVSCLADYPVLLDVIYEEAERLLDPVDIAVDSDILFSFVRARYREEWCGVFFTAFLNRTAQEALVLNRGIAGIQIHGLGYNLSEGKYIIANDDVDFLGNSARGGCIISNGEAGQISTLAKGCISVSYGRGGYSWQSEDVISLDFSGLIHDDFIGNSDD